MPEFLHMLSQSLLTSNAESCSLLFIIKVFLVLVSY